MAKGIHISDSVLTCDRCKDIQESTCRRAVPGCRISRSRFAGSHSQHRVPPGRDWQISLKPIGTFHCSMLFCSHTLHHVRPIDGMDRCWIGDTWSCNLSRMAPFFPATLWVEKHLDDAAFKFWCASNIGQCSIHCTRATRVSLLEIVYDVSLLFILCCFFSCSYYLSFTI